ncbi:cytochrome P450 [Rhizopogon vinicolor AM-OR11-026]|uniref:Cytochrome P450 n=1 Tax=Rhizopogon vinicolor AM-OR11-026 TaxID=1314800 RepID=A0A1B7MP69_9AGAM|nr:cytochrome P450 [Rhizopogon vinicolor AM-OR11-026]
MFDAGPGLYLATSAFVLVGLSWSQKYWNSRSHPPLPPGPPSFPIIGSILSLSDPVRPWLGFNAWRSRYGDIVYARLLNKPILVVNSEEIAKDLFDRRSTIYSDKPQSIVYEPFAADFAVGLMPYGDRWRLHRRILQHPFRQAAIPSYHNELLRGAHKMLFSILQDPTSYTSHFETFPLLFILPIMYDYEPKAKDDNVVHIIRRYLELLAANLGPGATMIMETFPFLLRLPIWLPGAAFKRASVECLQAGHDMMEIPFQQVKERMSHGRLSPCSVADAMNRMNGFENEVLETAIKDASSMAGVASETVIFDISCGFL